MDSERYMANLAGLKLLQASKVFSPLIFKNTEFKNKSESS